MIRVQWIVVSREAREEHDIGLGDRPTGAFPFVTDLEVIEGEDLGQVKRHFELPLRFVAENATSFGIGTSFDAMDARILTAPRGTVKPTE